AAFRQELWPRVEGFSLLRVWRCQHFRLASVRCNTQQTRAINREDYRAIQTPGGAVRRGGDAADGHGRAAVDRHLFQRADSVEESNPCPIGGEEGVVWYAQALERCCLHPIERT